MKRICVYTNEVHGNKKGNKEHGYSRWKRLGRN